MAEALAQMEPERPAMIPAGATWNAESGNWERSELDAEGERHGHAEFYRLDGSLFLRAEYHKGTCNGPFSMFHENGQLAREGQYLNGKLDGEVVAYASDGPSSLNLRSCCIPAGAFQLRARYSEGALLREAFFDRQGRELLSNGALLPERAAGVPATAEFDEGSDRWLLRTKTEQGDTLDRFFSTSGNLSEEIEYHDDSRTRRTFSMAGVRLEQAEHYRDGSFHGPRIRRFSSASESPYADPKVREEHAEFDRGHLVGTLRLFDDHDQLLVELPCGPRFDLKDDQKLQETFPELDQPPADLWRLARRRRSEGRSREALCIAACAAARSRDREALESFLSTTSLQLKRENRAAGGQALLDAPSLDLEHALDELLCGAEPSAVLRSLASLLAGRTRAALDLVEASLLLDPESVMTHLTRGLVRLELGHAEGALEDAGLVESESDAAAHFIRESVRLLYPKFGFWPLTEPLEPPDPEIPVVLPAQPLDRMRHQIQVYATRLLQRRASIQRLAHTPLHDRWLPPDTQFLLPDGPVLLDRRSAVIEDETEEGTESVEVEIDETLSSQNASVTTLMRGARADWAALCWLCWSAGLDRVALPEKLEPREDFAAAISMALRRTFRTKDKLNTGGLLARSRSVPGFAWEGIELDELEPHFALIPFAEYFEVRCALLWLMWPQNLSTFQSDLREA